MQNIVGGLPFAGRFGQKHAVRSEKIGFRDQSAERILVGVEHDRRIGANRPVYVL